MKKIVYALFAFIIALILPLSVQANIVQELQEKITERNQEILKLGKEIQAYQEELDRTGKQAQSLDNALKLLDLTDKKLSTDIKITEKKVNAAIDSINSLNYDINITGTRVDDNSKVLKTTLKERYTLESLSLVEILLANPTFSAFWSRVTYLERFETNMKNYVAELKNLKKELLEKEERIVNEKANLLSYKTRLVDQKEVVAVNMDSKERLLEETRNKESLYERILHDRVLKQEALEREIAEFEERLRVEVDPASLPETGTGVLAWPFDAVSITQYFGNTPFASANPQVYNGAGHNGIDLRGAIGTPVKAAANGVVVDTGDTDTQCYKVSYGRWILVRHYNGLSTLYAHLSLARVKPGDEVKRGDVVGYSGNSGYSTGPHLHFTVFASAAVRISEPEGPNKYVSKICGNYLKMPLSPRNGYLNPLSYLPQLETGK